MSIASPLPAHLRLRREKVFGDGRPRPLDRNVKARIMHLARALMRRTEKGKAYGHLTAKAVAVLEALLWAFHNARSGLCFPSYAKIAEAAGCARSTVAEALKALESFGLVSWVNRVVRVKERCVDLFGCPGTRVRVIRTSNSYMFNDPKGPAFNGFPSKSDFRSGTSNQDLPLSYVAAINQPKVVIKQPKVAPKLPEIDLDPFPELASILARHAASPADVRLTRR